jgi:phospholipase/lecithinase/hemolysin
MAFAISLPLATAKPDHAKNSVTKIYSFGDSLSDLGNFYNATGVPPFPYWEGRLSDGPVWIEHLAAKLQVPLDPADQYAWLGSMTGDTNFRDMPEAGIYFPGFEQQIDTFLADVGPEGADPQALYSVWIGANDVFDWLRKQNQTPENLIATGVGNTVQGIIDLSNAGAKHFIVGNLPDLGITPDIRDLGPFAAGMLSQLSYAYNLALEEQLQALEASMGIHITRLDAFAIINQVAADPEAFGLINVTDRALDSYPVSDPSEYLFWDGVHPTTAANEWVADFVCAALVKTYSHGEGRTPLPALNGLIHAATAQN